MLAKASGTSENNGSETRSNAYKLAAQNTEFCYMKLSWDYGSRGNMFDVLLVWHWYE
jgi:hypothetical protein